MYPGSVCETSFGFWKYFCYIAHGFCYKISVPNFRLKRDLAKITIPFFFCWEVHGKEKKSKVFFMERGSHEKLNKWMFVIESHCWPLLRHRAFCQWKSITRANNPSKSNSLVTQYVEISASPMCTPPLASWKSMSKSGTHRRTVVFSQFSLPKKAEYLKNG